MSRGPEYRFQSLLRGALDQRRPHTWHFKAHGSVFQAGVPDLLGCDAKHGCFGWELKAAESGQVDWSEVSELQRHTLKLIAAAGGDARVLFYHEKLRVILSPDAKRVPPRGEKWSAAEVDAFAAGNWPSYENAVPRELLAYATGAPKVRGGGGLGVAWEVYAVGDGWRVARLAPTTRGLPLDLVRAVGFGWRAPAGGRPEAPEARGT